jgi:hypothetical protein
LLLIIGLLIILYIRARLLNKKLHKNSSANSKIEYLYPVYQKNILLQLNVKYKYFYQWHSSENRMIKFGLSNFCKEGETVIVFWQTETMTEDVFYKLLAVEGSITNEIEQIQNVQPNTIVNLFNAEASNEFSATNCLSFNHSNGILAFSNNSVVISYNQVSKTLQVVNDENFLSTNNGDCILLVSVTGDEKLPSDLIKNLESVFQKHGYDENESLKQSLNGLFEMLEMSHPSLQPIRFVLLKP